MRTLTFNRVIGVGAMGTVYQTELRVPRGFTRTCAVKVMKTANPDQEQFRARMRDEARLLGMLQDEQILGVSELVEVAGHDCVVMEYVEGVDLAELMRQVDAASKTDGDGPRKVRVPAKALAELGAELAGTLHRAHSAVHPTTGEPLKVIHRDVKPANVMLTARGGVRLLDFGVARAAFESRESNTQGLVLGTLNYFPPEIMAGAEPTPAVDLYGLGLLLWECASGTAWGTPQVHRHRFERRVEQRLGELAPEYEPLVAIVRRLLSWRPGDRPTGTAAEKLLLAAAEVCPGVGLRAWARQVVPPLLEQRQTSITTDDLVGKTLPIATRTDPAPPAPPQRVDPTAPTVAPKPSSASAGARAPAGVQKLRPIDPGLLAEAERRAATSTFNDLAPPAAVIRPQERASRLSERPRGGEPAPAAAGDPRLDTGLLPELPLDNTDEEPANPSEAPTTRLPYPGRRSPRKSGGAGVRGTMMWLGFSAVLGLVVGAGVLVVAAVVTLMVVG